MSPSVRLLATPAPGRRTVAFRLAFAVPEASEQQVCAPAFFDAGDGHPIELGVLCSPTAWTWTEQQEQDLGVHGYDADGEFAASVKWGDLQVSAPVKVGQDWPMAATTDGAPTLNYFDVQTQETLSASVRLEVSGLAPDQRLRLDGGAGVIQMLTGKGGASQAATWTLEYAKPGAYTLALDLIDAEGFLVSRLVDQTVEIAGPEQEVLVDVAAVADLAEETAYSPLPEATASAPAGEPWLPHRYALPLWAYTPAFASPGTGQVSRRLAPGTYLSIHDERLVNDQVWYRTGSRDWVPSSSINFLTPSSLRGVELGGALPPPPPPPPPPADGRRGVVTADLLNVRVRPGVRPDNPPIDRLPRGTEVDIYDETTVAGDRWYRIGEDRWVFAGWVRLLDKSSLFPWLRPPSRGAVEAEALNVRSRPGIDPDNPPLTRVVAGTEVDILEEATVAGAVWYRIGEGQWVHGDWVRLPGVAEKELAVAGAAPGALPIGFVAANSLQVRRRPGVEEDNKPVGEIYRNQSFAVLETQLVDNAPWYAIGANRWVLGKWLRVARARPRPAAIGADKRWVGVNLRERTAVAYEGDRPVYAAMVSIGHPLTPTVQGVFRTWSRHATTKMAGAGYFMEGVTWTCYFHRGYALHTAFWHDDFGSARSHGCVNLSPYDAWWVFRWSAAGGSKSPAVHVYTA